MAQVREAREAQAAVSATVAKLERQYIEEQNLRREVSPQGTQHHNLSVLTFHPFPCPPSEKTSRHVDATPHQCEFSCICEKNCSVQLQV